MSLRSWPGSLHNVLLVCAALLVPASLLGQGELGNIATPYGNGQQARLSYAGQVAPSNVVLWDLGGDATYNDNLFGSSGPLTIGDTIYDLGTHVSILHQGQRLSAQVDYQPYFQLYQHTHEYDRANQTLAADIGYAITPHFSLRLRDSFTDESNTFQPQPGDTVVYGLTSPTSLNPTIIVPLAPERANVVRLDATYQESARTSVSFFGVYEQRRFLGQPGYDQQLLSTRGTAAGSNYTYRLSEHSSLGLLYVFQVLNSEGSLPQGSASSIAIHSALASIAWHPAPTLAFNVFAGPQYVLAGSVVGLPSAQPSPHQLDWAAGGTVTKEAGQFALLLSAQRIITDGGGFLAYVTSSSIDAGIRRSLSRRWDVIWDVSAGRNQSANLGFGSENIRSQIARIAVEHSLTDSLMTRLSYDFSSQRSAGELPLGANFNRSRISFGVYYRMRTIPLGH